MSSLLCRSILAGNEICRALVVLVSSPELVGSRVWRSRVNRLRHCGESFPIGTKLSVTNARLAVFARALPLCLSMSSSVLWLQFGCQMKVLVFQQRRQQ